MAEASSAPFGSYYFAEDYHQQYLAPTKNPNGYCCPVAERAAGHSRLAV